MRDLFRKNRLQDFFSLSLKTDGKWIGLPGFQYKDISGGKNTGFFIINYYDVAFNYIVC